ncbi:MAG: hypothetical protein ACM31M_07530 [Nitrososphaerota archaeon]
MNKIISLSVWGCNPRYIIGASRQIELAKKYYPDWRVRVYTDNKNNFKNEDADIIEVTDGTSGYFWRFYPLFESDDNIVIVRDCDGRITKREQMAVNEWLSSNKRFHTFRDHEAHFQFPVIACAFGYKGKLPIDIYEKMKFFEKTYFFYTNDQIFLRDYVWNYVSNDCLVHELYSGWFGDTRKQLKNKFSFCGNGFDENDIPLYPDRLTYQGNFDIDRLNNRFDEGILSE